MGDKAPNFPLGPALVLFGIVGVLLVALLSGQPRIPPAVPATFTEVAVVATATAVSPAEVTEGAEAVAYSESDITQGRSLFAGTCSACHGADARGIPGLGKNLATSTFVHDLSDAELVQFIIVGRPVTDPLNTTGVAMPPRGANPSLTDAQLQQIVAFIRSQQVNEFEAVAAPTEAPAVSGTAAPTTEFVLPITGMNLSDRAPTEPPPSPLATGTFTLPITGMNLSDHAPTSPPPTPLITGTIVMPSTGLNPVMPVPTEEATMDMSAAETQAAEVPATAEVTEAAPAPTTVAELPTGAPIQGAFDAANAYMLTCAGCHGANGEGGSASAVANWTLTDDQAFNLLTKIQLPDTAQPIFIHPTSGTYLYLSDDQVRSLIAYAHALAG